MQQHASIGATLVRQVNDDAIEGIAGIIEHHHERFDGRGYPHGLAGEAIPLASRIIAVVDSYDAITSHRRYHAPFPSVYALETIEKERGAQFDPEIAREFVALVEGME